MPTTAIAAVSARPDEKKGIVLPMMNSSGRIGVTMICSSVPTSRSRTTAKAVRLTTMIRVRVAMTPGTKNQRLLKSTLYQGRASSSRSAAGARAGVRAARQVLARSPARRRETIWPT